MSKKFYLILGLIGLVLVSFGVARLLTPPAYIADLPHHLMQALEEALEEEGASVNHDFGEITYITNWNQQEGLDLVTFWSQHGGGSAVLREDQGEVEVLAIRTLREDSPVRRPATAKRPSVMLWHIPDLKMAVGVVHMPTRFYSVEAVWNVEGQTKRVEYDVHVPGGTTRSMMFVRYEDFPPGSPVVYVYDKDGNQVGHAK